MKASIIISHIGERQINECLSRMKNQDYPDYEICEMNGKGMSEPTTQNLLIQRTSGDILFFTNADIYVPRNWISSHMKYYPQYDMVLGLPTITFKALSFTNFSIKKELFNKLGINDTTMQDFDLALRLTLYYKKHPFKYMIDKIPVIHDDNLTDMKKFTYIFNMMVLFKKYGILPSIEDAKYFFKRNPNPLNWVYILLGLLYPKSHTVNFRMKGIVKHK